MQRVSETHKHLQIKGVYVHHLDGRTWLVRLLAFDKDQPDIWFGELYGEQGGLANGTTVWGRVNELDAV